MMQGYPGGRPVFMRNRKGRKQAHKIGLILRKLIRIVAPTTTPKAGHGEGT